MPSCFAFCRYWMRWRFLYGMSKVHVFFKCWSREEFSKRWPNTYIMYLQHPWMDQVLHVPRWKGEALLLWFNPRVQRQSLRLRDWIPLLLVENICITKNSKIHQLLWALLNQYKLLVEREERIETLQLYKNSSNFCKITTYFHCPVPFIPSLSTYSSQSADTCPKLRNRHQR